MRNPVEPPCSFNYSAAVATFLIEDGEDVSELEGEPCLRAGHQLIVVGVVVEEGAHVAQVELGVLDDNPLPELEGNDRICGTVCPRLRDPTSRPTIGSKVSVHATFEIFFFPFLQK